MENQESPRVLRRNRLRVRGLGENYGEELENSVEQWSPTFLTPGTGFVEDHFSTDGGRGRGFGGWFRR